MVLASTSLLVAAYVELAVAVVVGVVSLGVIARVVLANRRDRRSRNESIRSYYGHGRVAHAR